MNQFTPQLNHHILTQYSPHNHAHSFSTLANAYNVSGGESAIRKWHYKWNGTPQSLERKKGSGRPRIMGKKQVHQYIRMPIQNKRRHHLPVHCPELHANLVQKTGLQISSRSIRRYARRDGKAKLIHTHKKTKHECEYIHVFNSMRMSCY